MSMRKGSLTQTVVHPSPGAHGGASYSSNTMQNHNGRLRYANPKDLPSFPTVGIKDNDAASSAAASLGWANQKQFEHWKPGATPSSASKAAMLAKDYKAGPGWQPESNSAGAQAAVLAAGSAKAAINNPGHKRETSSSTTLSTAARPNPATAASASMATWGNSAANLAFKASPTKKPAQLAMTSAAAAPSVASPRPDNSGMAPLERQKSLRAAKGAMAASNNRTRPRSKSTPTAPEPTYPDQRNAAANALSAATSAHRPTTTSHPTAGAVPYTTMNRQMFTSHPPVRPEVEEQRRADVIHASAVAMAKRMYNQQQRAIDATKKAHAAAAASATAGRESPAASSEASSQPQPYVNLQEAAYKLAQERLAKLHDEHQRGRDMQEYYGVGAGSTAASGQGGAGQANRRFSIRNKLRRRASSDGAIEDRKQSEHIRQQMSAFSTKLTEVDAQKRQRDRDAVLAAAQRNVRARLEGMDRSIAGETGRPNPTVLSEWQLKAHAAARSRSEARGREGEGVHGGKIDIGGGKWVDPKEVEEVAARRVQPVLDEINERAEKERERLLALKLEEEKRREDEEKRKAREREVHEIHEKLKHEQKEKEKALKDEIKREEKLRKDAEKAARAEQKSEAKQEERARKDAEKAIKAEEKATKAEEKAEAKAEQKRHSLDLKRKGKEPAAALTSPTSPRARRNSSPTPEPDSATHRRRFPTFENISTKSKSGDTDKSPKSPSGDDASSPTSKVKTWLKSRFTRPRAKTETPTSAPSGEGGFVGGHTLHRRNADSLSSLDHSRSASMREVAMAGRTGGTPAAQRGSGLIGRSGVDSSVSSLSESDGGFEVVRGNRGSAGSGIGGALSPPPPPRALRDPARTSASPVRDSRFLEDLDS